MPKKYYVEANLDYVVGHLRTGHLEGTVELDDEDLAKLKKNPNFAKELGLDTMVDDWRVDDFGAVDGIDVYELDEAGNRKQIDMTEEETESDDN